MATMRVPLSLLLATIVSFISESSSTEAVPSPVYGVPSQETSPNSLAQYTYAYDVRDPHSGVYTSKKETRDGDVVYGNYVVEDADGSRRTVYYSADPVRGFNAEVRRQSGSPQQVQDRAQAVPVPIPLPVALPVIHTYVAPPPPPPPSLPQVHQVQFGPPVAFSLSPAVLTRTSSPSEIESPWYHTSLSSPTHSYSY